MLLQGVEVGLAGVSRLLGRLKEEAFKSEFAGNTLVLGGIKQTSLNSVKGCPSHQHRTVHRSNMSKFRQFKRL